MVPTQNKTSNVRRLRALALAGLAVAAAAAPEAGATTISMRPDSGRAGGWTSVRASTAYRAIDEQIGSGGRVPARDLIAAKRRGRTAVIGVDDPAIPAGEAPVALSAYYYAGTGKATRLRASVAWGGRTRASKVLRPRSRHAWYRLDVPVPAAEEVAGVQIQFRTVGGTRASVRVAYVDVTTQPVEGEEPPPPPPASGDVQVFGSTTSIRPDRALPAGGSPEAKLFAARNEFESFQIAVAPESGSLQGVRITQQGALSGPGGEIPASNVTIYREEYYEVSAADGKPRSSRNGGEGLWPDALIPERDPYYGEDRAAFPIDVASGSMAVAWVDVFVPADTPPGTYTTSFTVSGSGGEIASVPVTVRVADYTMPSTSSLRNAFLMTPPGYFPCKAHVDVDWCYQEDETSWKLDYLYSRAALENRVTIPNAVPGGFAQSPDEAKFIEYLLPLINGSDDGGIDGTLAPRLQGAELTTVSTMWQCITNGQCLSDYRALAEEHGFADKFIAYVCDEPFDNDTPEYWNDWRDCRDNARLAEQRWPGIETLVTSTIQGADSAENAGKIDVSRDIDVLVPPVNLMANRAGNPQVGDQRPAYNSFLSDSDNESWIYTMCAQFSCDELEAPYFDGWPAYAIDQPASQARSMSWMAYRYDLDGELYYNTTLALDTAWQDQYRWGGNGDGTLFYPGSPTGHGDAPAIGGQHDIPIESLRLKRIRDGREDYELMNALATSGRAATADAVITGLVGPRDTAMFHTDVAQADVDQARCDLLGSLDSSLTDCAA